MLEYFLWVVFFLEEKERYIWRTRRIEGWKKRRIHYPCCVFFPLDVVVDEALCVCCLFSVSSGSNWWISDDYSNVGGLQKDKLWRKKRKGNCVVWRRSVTARPLSVFVFFALSFCLSFSLLGVGQRGAPRGERTSGGLFPGWSNQSVSSSPKGKDTSR